MWFKLLKGPDGKSKGIVFITYENQKSADDLLLAGGKLGDRVLKVKRATDKPEGRHEEIKEPRSDESETVYVG